MHRPVVKPPCAFFVLDDHVQILQGSNFRFHGVFRLSLAAPCMTVLGLGRPINSPLAFLLGAYERVIAGPSHGRPQPTELHQYQTSSARSVPLGH
jgi:hypothetical protein